MTSAAYESFHAHIMALDRKNIARNLAGHGLMMAVVTMFLWLLWHIDGWFGRNFAASEAHFARDNVTGLLWRIVPALVAIAVIAEFLTPKRDIRMRTGGLFPHATFRFDDPHHVMWPARIAGVTLTLAAMHIRGDALIRLLAATLP